MTLQLSIHCSTITRMNTKRCSTCKEFKPLEDFANNRAMKDGKQNACRECHKKHVAKYISKPEKRRNKLEKGKEYYENNKEKIAPIRRKRDTKRWHNDPNYRQKKNEQSLERYASNRTGYRTSRRIQGMIALPSHQKKRLTGKYEPYTYEDWLGLLEKYGDKCLCCGEKKELRPEHVIPISKGGDHSIDNIQPLCLHCNFVKGVKDTDYRPDRQKVLEPLA